MRDLGAARWLPVGIGLLAVTAAILTGFTLRLEDPASTEALPAEDPYTHMAWTRQHLQNGEMNALHEGGDIYPPGMHALLATTWIYTGADLLEIVRYAPVLFGAIGILGMALLLWRHLGPAPAVVGAFAYALAPEVVFRTTMMSPTAIDLAMVPFFLFVLLEIAQGRLAWLGAGGPMVFFFAMMHPWLLWVLAATGIVFVVLLFILGWPMEGATMRPKGLAAILGLIGAAIAAAAASGAAKELNPPDWLPLKELAGAILVFSLVPYLVVSWGADWFHKRFGARRRIGLPVWAALPFAGLLGAGLLTVTRTALDKGLPPHVSLEYMIGWPILGAAIAALLLLPFVRSPIAHLGAAFAIVTYPFAIHDVFSSPYWPHRTVAFFAIGAVILVGVATWIAERFVRVLGRQIRHIVGTIAARSKKGSASLIRPSRQVFASVVPLLLAGGVLGGGVYANTPDPYAGWYRLFDDCEHEALEAVAAHVRSEPEAIVVTGSWQAKAVISAMTVDATRIWYSPGFFDSESERDGVAIWLSNEDRGLYIVLDPHAHEKLADVNLTYVASSPWVPLDAGCPPDGSTERGVAVYIHEDTR